MPKYIEHTFQIIDQEGFWLCEGDFDYCKNFLIKSKESGMFAKNKISKWDIIKLTQ